MGRLLACTVLLLAMVPAGVAGAAEKKDYVEDEALPRPAQGQPSDYYAELAGIQAAYGLFEAAEKLQLKAIEVEEGAGAKERLSFQLVDDIYCRAEWWDKAAEELLRTLRLVPEEATRQRRTYHRIRAKVLNEAGRTDEYVAELERVVRLSDTEDEKLRALRTLHLALKRLDRLEEKVAEYEARVVKDPGDVTTLRLLAEIYYGSGLLNLPGKAIRKCEQILAADPDNLHACERLARLYVEATELEKALAMTERLFALNPARFKVYFLDAVSYMLTEKKEDQALEWCKELERRHPKQAAVVLRIGHLYDGRRQYAEAAEYYKKALPLVDLYTEQLAVYFRLIEAQLAARRYAEAEATCREAQKLIRSSSLRNRLKALLNRALESQGKPEEE